MTSFLLIDAHNAIFARPELARLHQRNPAAAREKFLQMLERLQDAGHKRVVAVFDGRSGGKTGSEFSGTAGVQVFYAPSADAVIEQLVAKYAKTRNLTVATNDLLVRTAVEASGASSIGVEQLFGEIAEAEKGLSETLARLRRRR